MGRFANMLGKLEFNISGEDISITPKMGDNKRLMKIMTENDEAKRIDLLEQFIFDLLKREYPDEPADELRMFVEFNFMDFLKEILIGFKYITREQWEANAGDVEKKLMSGV